MKMRTWCLLPAFVPAAAWGNYGQCNDRQSITELTLSARDTLSRGILEVVLLEWEGNVEPAVIQAAPYKAVEIYTFPHPEASSVSTEVTVMQFACKKVYRR